jgi:apolipoprotein N-acyltransferase
VKTGSSVAPKTPAPVSPQIVRPFAPSRPSVPFPLAILAALGGAATMAFAFPKTNLAWLAPLGLIALFWAWFRCTPVRAFFLGWLAGTIYFCIVLSWIAETAGSLVAPYGFALVLAPSIIEGASFALAGLLAVIARRSAPHAVAPLAAAAAFALSEWLRSTGPLGVPFGNLSYTQVEGPIAALAAYAGSFGITFALALAAAYLAAALPPGNSFRSIRNGTIALAAVIALGALAWWGWPVRSFAGGAPSLAATAAIVQPNIRQSLKWQPESVAPAIERSVAMTQQTAASKPLFVLWPETVIPLDLNLAPEVLYRFRELARAQNTTLIVGARQLRSATSYNALYFFTPDGGLANVYRKRQLVPFVESLPAPNLLGRFPGASLVSRFGEGDSDGVLHIGPRIVAPLICWESAFTDLAVDDVRNGADVLLIATDDAWFGTTAGPYQHAQIAQMRAIETGAWVVRAAATGISGIIAPTGRYSAETKLETQDVLAGPIGEPAPTVYAHLGSYPIALGFALIYLGAVLFPKRRRE